MGEPEREFLRREMRDGGTPDVPTKSGGTVRRMISRMERGKDRRNNQPIPSECASSEIGRHDVGRNGNAGGRRRERGGRR